MSASHTIGGTLGLLRLNLRVDRVRGSAWTFGIVGLVLMSAFSVHDLYSTPREISAYVSMLHTSPAMENVNRIFNGPGIGFEHPNGGVVLLNEIGVWGAVAFSLMAVFLTARHTRTAEEAGQLDLLRAQAVGRHAPLAAAGALVAILEGTAGALAFLGLILMGYDPAGAATLAIAFVAVGYVFAVVTAIAAQIASTGRATVGVSLAIFGLAFVVRAIGDMSGGALSWLSPLGWVHRIRPFAHEQWWVMSLFLAATIGGSAIALGLADRRDLGSGMIGQRPGPESASAIGARPLGLLLRLQRGSILAWGIGVCVLGVAYGSVAEDIESVFADNPDLAQFMPSNGHSPTDTYLAYTLKIGCLLVCGAAIAAMLRLRHDEVEGRVELVLANSVGRARWMADHAAVAVGVAVTTLVASGVGTGVGLALTTGEPRELLRLSGASVALLPVPIALVGVTALLIGAAPRFAALSWVALAAIVAIALLGDVLRLPDWIRSVSPLDHLPQVPAGAFEPGAFAAVTVIGVLLVALGAAAFTRRDIPRT